MWFLLALFVALSTSVSTPIVKKLTEEISPVFLLFATNILVLPLMFVVLYYFGGIPDITTNFVLFMIIVACLDAIAFITSVWAIKISPISLIVPISSFNPVFTSLIAIFTLNEIPTTLKFAGIILVVAGTYLLNISEIKGGILAPIKKLMINRGIQLFFIANFLWSITPIFQKKAIFETSPVTPFFPSVFSFTLMTIVLIPVALKKYKQNIKPTRNFIWLLALSAPFVVFSQIAAYSVFSEVNVGYATAIFKLSILFTIIWGGLIFKEKNIKEKLIGAGVMVLGTILIVL